MNRFEHDRSIASETTPLLVPPTSSEAPGQGSQQLGGEYSPQFEWSEIVWVVAAIFSAVFLGALDGGQISVTASLFPDCRIRIGTIVATLMTPVRQYSEPGTQFGHRSPMLSKI